MTYTVTPDSLNISLNETDPVKSVMQNVAIILRTRQMTCPMYREFGLPYDFIGKPVNAARALFISEIAEAVEKFEPRAKVKSVTFSGDKDNPSELIPTVEVEINE